jgi:putative membrane protein
VSDGAATQGRFFGRPVPWIAFAMILLAVPILGYMVEAGMPWSEIHPALNALLNATAAVFLVVGYAAIRRRELDVHRSCMVAAFVMSSVFLVSYLIRWGTTGTHYYPGEGLAKAIYLVILFSHMILAAALVPLALRALYFAWKKSFVRHRRVARVAWPMWLYVSVTGVVVYLMLYPFSPAS